MSPAPSPTARPSTTTRPGQVDRRVILWSAALLAVAIVGGVILVAATVDSGPRRDTQGQLEEDGGAKPHIIARPNSGRAPENPGDRGGWEQLTLFGLIVAAMAGIGLAIFRGGAKARAGRQAWRDAAATGRDGAAEDPSAAPTSG